MSSINGAARLINEASPKPTNLETAAKMSTVYFCCEGINKEKKLSKLTYMRQIVMDQKSNEQPQPITATVQTDNPTPISLNGLKLQNSIQLQ